MADSGEIRLTHRNITLEAHPPQSQQPSRGRLVALGLALTLSLTATGCGGGGGGSSGTMPSVPAAPNPAPVIAGCRLLYPSASQPTQAGAVDPLLAAQWHLQPSNPLAGIMGLGATLAWAKAQGRGVRVAVIDGPVETLHGDLSPNAVPGGSFDYRLGSATAPLPCTFQEAHGTAVAGILAAARSNGLAGAGVAPLASVVAYNAIEAGARAELTLQRIANALGRDTANQVYNLSWGSDDDGALHPADANVAAAIAQGMRQGRGGLGSVYVFASGNGGCQTVDGRADADPLDPTRCQYRDMTGFDGHLNLPGTFTACAVDRQGRLPVWGEEGENLLVCGLSGDGAQGITTLAPGNGTRTDFGGASAAAPMVSGVIALILEARPTLSWRDIRLILAETARENQPDDPSWAATALDRWPAQWLGGQPVRKRFSRRFGFGVVDAAAAVERALTFQPSIGAAVGPGTAIRSCEKTRSPGITLSDPGNTLFWQSDTLRFDGSDPADTDCPDRIEWVEVMFSATHPYAADLQIELISPDGRVSRLADSRVCGGVGKGGAFGGPDRCGAYAGWRFLANRHLGESPRGDSGQGNWTLRVADAVVGDIGTWQSWTLRFSGR